MLRVARARAPRARVNGARARRRARRSAARRTEATGNGGEHEPPPPPGGVVSFVLCAPEGPLNVGAAARVIQNFSLPSSLRVVRPSASVLRDDDDGASAPRLHEDAYKFAVHAKWMLDDCCARGESVLEAVAEASLVVATTARPRENLPLLTLGAACEKMRDEIARGGKCAILFGNERTGLTNEELELAEFGVSIPTSATVGTSAMARRNKYSGGAGVDGSQTATSLNLGMAVGVVAYELFSQVHEVREDDETKSIGGFNQPHRLTVGERAALIDDVVAARRAVDVFADVDAEEDVIFAEKERRAITAVLSSGPIATRDATPIFMLARRARARPARGPERVSRRRGARVRASQRWRRAEHQISQRVHSRNIRHQSHEARARARRSVGSRRLAALSAAAPAQFTMRVGPSCARAASSASSASSASRSSASKQVLRLKHRGRDVFLIGTMHYNPASIRLCEETVSTLRPRLGAVVLETCPKRWEKTLTYQPAGSVMRSVLDNEFQSAAEAAGDDAEIVLGDQEIAALGENLGRLVKETAFDLLYPPRAFTGGWKSYADDVREAVATEIDGGDEGVDAMDLFGDGKLLLNAPVSLIRYPLAWLLKSPKLIVPLASFWLTIAALPGAVEALPEGAAQSSAETLVTDLFLMLDFLQVTLLSRCFLVALLRDRNEILARSIADACERVPEGNAVVAVLGAAHLNGVRRRLVE